MYSGPKGIFEKSRKTPVLLPGEFGIELNPLVKTRARQCKYFFSYGVDRVGSGWFSNIWYRPQSKQHLAVGNRLGGACDRSQTHVFFSCVAVKKNLAKQSAQIITYVRPQDICPKRLHHCALVGTHLSTSSWEELSCE